MTRRRRAAVVGCGAVTPIGGNFTETWTSLLAGRSGVGPITRFDASQYPVRFAAEVAERGAGPELYEMLLDKALDEALADLDLSGIPSDRIGVFLGSESVRPEFNRLAGSLLSNGLANPAEIAAHLPMQVTLRVVHRLGSTGPTATLSTACTSSGQAIGEAMLAIRRGEVDVAVAGGVDVLVHPLMVTGFARLGALSTRNDDPVGACRPFDLSRDGFVLGEGCGLMVLASEEFASQVGAVSGWLSGYGCSSNAWRITDSPPDGRGAASAMAAALHDSGRRAEEVVYVNAHGTGTLQNDVSEARGICTVLGHEASEAVCSSTKSMMGHLVAACGVVEALVTLAAVREKVAPPTINLSQPDPDCPVRHVPWTPRVIKQGVGISNAFGFGGSNASVVLEAP